MPRRDKSQAMRGHIVEGRTVVESAIIEAQGDKGTFLKRLEAAVKAGQILPSEAADARAAWASGNAAAHPGWEGATYSDAASDAATFGGPRVFSPDEAVPEDPSDPFLPESQRSENWHRNERLGFHKKR